MEKVLILQACNEATANQIAEIFKAQGADVAILNAKEAQAFLSDFAGSQSTKDLKAKKQAVFQMNSNPVPTASATVSKTSSKPIAQASAAATDDYKGFSATEKELIKNL